MTVEYIPAEQGVQAAIPADAPQDPAAQMLHSVAAYSELNFPAVHATHTLSELWPVPVANVPG